MYGGFETMTSKLPMLIGGQMLNLQEPSHLHIMGEVVNQANFMWTAAPHAEYDHDFAEFPLNDKNARSESGNTEPKLTLPLFTSKEFRDAASRAWFAFNLNQMEAPNSRNIDPLFFVGPGGAVGLSAMPDLMVQLSSHEYVAMMREAYGENVPPPESSAYLLCCTAIATSSVKFGSLPKLLFNLETKDLALADRWAEVPEKFMALPYVMTIIT